MLKLTDTNCIFGELVYEQFYGLNSQPFRLSPDPAFFFGSPGHTRALAYLRYGLNQKEGFIVITGSPGTGKTTLARALLQEIGRDKIIVAELNTTHLDPDDVLRMVAASFGLEHESLPKSTLLKRLEAFFISRTRAGYHILLLVDEAQNLPYGSLEELRMLSNFYLGKNALIQIFLLGQEQFRNSLYSSELEQLRQRVVASSHLEPLTQEETRDYIEHRLKLSGWQGNPNISDRAFARLFTLTKGVPRRINTFCERLLLYGALEELTAFHDDTIKAVAKELMYEVSAKGVKLSDINPGVPEDHVDSSAKVLTDAATQKADAGAIKNDANEITPNLDNTSKLEVSNVELQAEVDVLSSFSDDINDVSSDTDIESDDSGFVENQKVVTSEDDEITGEAVSSEKPLEQSVVKLPKAEPVDSESIKKKEQKKEQKNNTHNTAERRPLRIVSKSNAAENQALAEPESETPIDDTKPDWWELVALAVDYHRDPTKLKSLESNKTPIPAGIIGCFKIAIGKLIVPVYLRTENLAKLTDQQICDAIRYYIKNILLSNTADYYRRLGVKPSASFDEIRTHYKYLFRLFQPDKEQNASNWDETFTRRINQAYGTLRSTDKRKEYDEFLVAINLRNRKTTDEAENVIASENAEESLESNEHNNDVGEKKPNRAATVVGLILAGLLAVAGGALYVVQPDYKSVLINLGVPEEKIPANLFEGALSGSDTDALIEQPFADQFESDSKNHVDVHDDKISDVRVDEENQSTVVADSQSMIVPSEILEDNKQSLILHQAEVLVEKADVSASVISDKALAPINAGLDNQVETKKQQSSTNEELAVSQVVKSELVHIIEKAIVLAPATAQPVIKNEIKNTGVSSDVKLVSTQKTENLKKQTPETSAPEIKAVPVKAAPEQEKTVIKKVVKQSAIINVSVASNVTTKAEIITHDNVKIIASTTLQSNTVLPKNISKQELINFATNFSLAYEEGDLNVFMTYFADNASTNDAKSKLGIREDYEGLFSSTEMRVIDLDNLNWKIRKQKAIGKGDFVVTVLGLGGGEMKSFSGIIKLEVVKIGDKLKLKGMFHVYETK